jgi:DNA-binding MarR family transcriptional regulator
MNDTARITVTGIHLTANFGDVRKVWNLVSEDHGITVRQIAKSIQKSVSHTQNILKFLEDAGYIEHKERRTGRTVVIPFVTVQKQ